MRGIYQRYIQAIGVNNLLFATPLVFRGFVFVDLTVVFRDKIMGVPIFSLKNNTKHRKKGGVALIIHAKVQF
jgi:hypothetical protein